MKSAIVLTGNLRTFFMPIRENSNMRVCDVFMKNIVKYNDCDIFICTDTNDFYYDGTQWFLNNQIDVVNADSHRLYPVIKFTTSETARKIITNELQNFFGNRLKGILVLDKEDVFSDEKYKILSNKGLGGVIPEMLIGQYKKLLYCSNLLEDFEKSRNFKYDLIFKGRFDAGYTLNSILNFSSFNYANTDIYVPGIKCSMILDWFAFGNGKSMKSYLQLYNDLGVKIPSSKYAFECQRDNANWSENSPDVRPCPICKESDKVIIGDITLSSENHLYEMFQEKNIKFAGAGYHVYVYRYRDVADSHSITIEEVVKNNLQNKDILLVNHQLHCTLHDKIFKHE